MASLGKIACRAVGTIGMGFALFDAVRASDTLGRHKSQTETADYLERRYFNARTIDNISANSNRARSKTFDLMTKNPLPSIWGRIKGSVTGFLYSMGNNLPLVACSALALLGKNITAKVGAIGIGCCAIYSIARNGFGVGKKHPMN